MSECSLSKSDERIPTSCAPHPTYPTPFRSLTRQPVPRSHSPSPCLAWCHPPAHTLQPIAARTPPRGHARETCRFNKESATRPGSWPCRRYPSRGEVPKPRGGPRSPSPGEVPKPRGGSQAVDPLGTHHQAWEPPFQASRSTTRRSTTTTYPVLALPPVRTSRARATRAAGYPRGPQPEGKSLSRGGFPSRGEVPKPRGGSQAERRFPSREKVPNPRGGSQPVDHLGTHHQAWEAWSRKPIRPTCPHRASATASISTGRACSDESSALSHMVLAWRSCLIQKCSAALVVARGEATDPAW